MPKLASSRGMQPWLPVIGAATGALLYLFAQGIVLLGQLIGGGIGFAVSALGYLLVLAAPVSGLVAARVASETTGEPLHAGAVGLVIVGGMFAVGLLAVILH